MSQSERWQLGGNAPEVYETELVPAIFAPWAPLLVAKAALHEGERVLDVACGTGVVARLAAPQVGTGGHVVGLDLNPGMLAVRLRARGGPQWNGGKGTREYCPLVLRPLTLSLPARTPVLSRSSESCSRNVSRPQARWPSRGTGLACNRSQPGLPGARGGSRAVR